MTCESSSSTDSVISTISREAGRPLSSSAASTSGTSSPLRTWRAETLTATPSSVSSQRGDRGARLAQHPPADLGDQRRLLGQRDELRRGRPRRRCGCRQRRRASTETVRCMTTSTTGWKTSRSSPRAQRAVEVGAQGGAPVLRDAQRVVVAVHRAGAGGPGAAQRDVAAAEAPRRCRRRGAAPMTPAAAVSRSGAGGGRERADGGHQPGGDDLGVGDAAVDEDDEVAVLAAGQPVLAAQAAGEPGGERAQGGGLGARGRRASASRPLRPISARADGRPAGLALHGAEPADQRRAVGQPGDRVGEGELEQFGVDARTRGRGR